LQDIPPQLKASFSNCAKCVGPCAGKRKRGVMGDVLDDMLDAAIEQEKQDELNKLRAELAEVKAERDALQKENGRLRLSKVLPYTELLECLVELLKTHSKLNQAEYDRNPSYNNTHPAYISEENAIRVLEKHFGGSIAKILSAEESEERWKNG
jgi:hypothetical protein